MGDGTLRGSVGTGLAYGSWDVLLWTDRPPAGQEPVATRSTGFGGGEMGKEIFEF